MPRDGGQSENDRGQNKEKKMKRSRAVLTQREEDSKIGSVRCWIETSCCHRPAWETAGLLHEASMDHGRSLTPLCVHSGVDAVVDFERRRGNHMLTKSGFYE